jgi:hypothetical protein
MFVDAVPDPGEPNQTMIQFNFKHFFSFFCKCSLLKREVKPESLITVTTAMCLFCLPRFDLLHSYIH